MHTNTINGTYGSDNTPCTVYTATDSSGATWYAVEDSLNVNCTYDTVVDGIDVEILSDHDAFTAGNTINSESDLQEAVES